MAEWGIPFHVIENEWTDRQFWLMADRLVERMQERRRQERKARGKQSYKDAVLSGDW